MVEFKKAILPAVAVATVISAAHGLTHKLTEEKPIKEQVIIAGAVVFVLTLGAGLVGLTMLD